MTYDPQRALALLQRGAQSSAAKFRPGQEEAIRHMVNGTGRLLVVQRTGWGKSFVYFIATRLLRNTGLGPTLLVSPLLSLMRNQILAAARMGVRAKTINSDNQEEWLEVESAVHANDVDILLITPERLNNAHFQNNILTPIADKISMLVIDEAHCISDWGHDFRPHYRLLRHVIDHLPPNLRLLATTATANDRVIDDLKDILGNNLKISRGDLRRPSLILQTMRMSGQNERLAWLAQQLPELAGSGIIYALTVRDAQTVAAWLRSCGLKVEHYTSDSDNRPQLEDALLANHLKALVATTALGMGFDKPDLSFVIHYQAPGSVINYYQQVGRAGRQLAKAFGVLLHGDEDNRINDFFIHSAFPSREEATEIIDVLDKSENGLSRYELWQKINLSPNRIEKTLLLLSLESPAAVVKDGTKWQRTVAPVGNEFWQRVDRLTQLRQQEQKEMQKYINLPSGHMKFLIEALDGEFLGDNSPSGELLPTAIDNALVLKATAFLHRLNIPIVPRRQWPGGGLPIYQVGGRIPENLRPQEGKALCRWGDVGWGPLVQQGKSAGHFDDTLVQACRELVNQWNPQPKPTWTTCVPSSRGTNLMPNFAQRLAETLEIPFCPVVELTGDNDQHQQKDMHNSVQQANNIDGRWRLNPTIPQGPVLLLDDMVDSQWTFTVVSWLLLSHGVASVFPLALADTGTQ